MRNFLIYTAIVCLTILNICLLLGAKPEPPPDYYLTSDITGDNEWVLEKDDYISLTFPGYIEDPKPGQILTWDGDKFKWVYLKDLEVSK